MRTSRFFYNKFNNKVMVAVVLLLGVMAWKGNTTPVVQADTFSESTAGEDEASSDENIITFEHGTCTVTLDTDSGVLTIGSGKLDGPESIIEDPSQYPLSVRLNEKQEGASDLVKTIEIKPGVIAPSMSRLLFGSFANLTQINGLSNVNVENVQYFTSMFGNLPKMTSIDISSWKNNQKEVTAPYMFEGDSSLKTIVLGDIFHAEDGRNKTDTQLMFTGCGNLSKIIIPDGVSFYLSQGETGHDIIIANKFYEPESNIIKDVGLDKDVPVGKKLEGPIVAATQGPNQVFVNEYLKYKIDDVEKTEKLSDHKIVDIGSTDSIKVPEIPGYTPNVKTVSFDVPEYSEEDLNKVNDLYYPDNSETESEVVDYVKNPEPEPDPEPVKPEKPSNNSNSSNNSNPIKNTNLLVSTFPAKEFANLYNGEGTKITNRALAGGTDWKVDQSKIYNGEKYYRVATDEWVKDSNVYVYEDKDLTVKTGENVQNLTSSQGESVSNRALSAKTDWRIDRLAHINDSTYYRVATDEFVPTESVTIN